ncbi:hypothetical protein BJ138DRAFT_826583 [Hygrophoropsis aurantiaca]|uniref:Uncharacterized protein n=1 Tax=Hygrophoropsis aurantiaca TaxID=72124 RepID=A0ACB8AT37_9AGAM|nr:hypothetical protein BJ138DRAFT_826583 [Hygrophoropsis aurantiaca]
MPKCLDLSRLPKAQGLKSVKLRNTTPGSPFPLLFQAIPFEPKRVLNPGHPATRLHPRAFPSFNCPAFQIRAVPKDALTRPDVEHLNPTKSRGMRQRSIPLSILFIIPKKTTSKHAVIRHRLSTRFKSAVALVVTRNADAVALDHPEIIRQTCEPSVDAALNVPLQEVKGAEPGRSTCDTLQRTGEPKKTDSHIITTVASRRLSLVSRDGMLTPAGFPWIMTNWTYVVTPALSVCRMPLPELILPVRSALERIGEQCRRLEKQWEARTKQTQHLKETTRTKKPKTGTSYSGGETQRRFTPQPKQMEEKSFSPLDQSRLQRQETTYNPLPVLPPLLERSEGEHPIQPNMSSLPTPSTERQATGSKSSPSEIVDSTTSALVPDQGVRAKTIQRLFSKRPALVKSDTS